MILDKKQIWAIFIFEFKMGHKAAKTTCNINNAFGPGTSNEHTVQWWFKKFCKGHKSLEDEEHSGQPSEVDNDQLRAIMELILLQVHKKLPKNPISTILPSFSIWSKLERWKSSISGCLMTWQQIKEIVILKCCLLIIYTTMNHFLIGLCRVTKSGFYRTTGKNQLSSWTLKKLQSTA